MVAEGSDKCGVAHLTATKPQDLRTLAREPEKRSKSAVPPWQSFEGIASLHYFAVTALSFHHRGSCRAARGRRGDGAEANEKSEGAGSNKPALQARLKVRPQQAADTYQASASVPW